MTDKEVALLILADLEERAIEMRDIVLATSSDVSTIFLVESFAELAGLASALRMLVFQIRDKPLKSPEPNLPDVPF